MTTTPFFRRKAVRTTLGLTLAAALAATAWGGWRLLAPVDPEQRYKIATVSQGDLRQTVAANGTLNPVTLVNVGTQVSGTVKKLYVDFNSHVKAGQKLLELDNAVLEAVAKQSAANVINQQAQADLARATEKRMQELFKQEYISRQELDNAVQGRKSSEAQLTQAKATAERDRINLGYATIYSPVSGVVVDRQVDVGQTVAASFQTPTLFKIAQDLTQMQIYSNFAEADIGNIKVEQKVRFTVDAFPNRHFFGKVAQIRLNPTTQQNVVTYNVVVAVENPEQLLLPGMTAYVNIGVAERKDVLQVPNAALRYRPAEAKGESKDSKGAPGQPPRGANEARPNGGNAAPGEGKRRREGASNQGTVYVLDGKALKPVPVQLGITDNRFTEITGGELKAGDRVVTGEQQPNAEASSGPGGSSNVRMRLF